MKNLIFNLFFLFLLSFSLLANNAPDSALRDQLLTKLSQEPAIQLDLYVMSQCPYGVQAETHLIPILRELEDRVDFNLYFISSETAEGGFKSMHGEAEVNENRIQLAIARNYPELLLTYLELRSENYSEDNCTDALTKIGLNTREITQLINTPEEVLAYRKNIIRSNVKQIFGSPSLFINGIKYRGAYQVRGARNAMMDMECVGGADEGIACTSDINCSHACENGTNDGTECTSNINCTGGGTCTDLGTCSNLGTCTNLGACEPLPVELVYFQVNAYQNDVVIATWVTASELNNKGFYLERSQDGIRWESIDFIDGKGTSDQETKYTYQDKSPAVGISYYRLKQVDFDGGSEVFKIQVIELKGKEDIQVQVFPNPVSGPASIFINSQITGTLEVKFYNILGQEVQQKSLDVTPGETVIIMETAHLARGTFQVVLMHDGMLLSNNRLVVE